MSVVTCTLDRGSPEMRERADLQAYYNATYLIEGTSMTNVITVRDQARGRGPDPLPSIGDTYNVRGGSDLGSYCQSIRLRRDPQAVERLWYADVEWMPLPEGKQPGDLNPNTHPLNRPTRYWVEWATETKPVEKARIQVDIGGLGGLNSVAKGTLIPFQTSALTPYDSQLSEDVRYIIFAQQKNIPNYAQAVFFELNYGNTTNNATWSGVPEHCARFLGAETSQPITERFQNQNIAYYTMTVKIAIKREPWYIDIVNRGYQARNVFADLYQITVDQINEDGTKTKVFPTEPQLLNLDGSHKTEGVGEYLPYLTLNPVDYTGITI